ERRLAVSRLLMGEVPGAEGLNPGLEDPVIAVVQFPAHVIVERGDVGRAESGGLRIVIGTLAQGVEVRAGEASVEPPGGHAGVTLQVLADRKSTRLNSSHRTISYAVFCLKK